MSVRITFKTRPPACSHVNLPCRNLGTLLDETVRQHRPMPAEDEQDTVLNVPASRTQLTHPSAQGRCERPLQLVAKLLQPRHPFQHLQPRPFRQPVQPLPYRTRPIRLRKEHNICGRYHCLLFQPSVYLLSCLCIIALLRSVVNPMLRSSHLVIPRSPCSVPSALAGTRMS